MRAFSLALAVVFGIAVGARGASGTVLVSEQLERLRSGPAARGFEGVVIVLDPGHGGADPGALSSEGLLEKDVVLAVCHHLRHLLELAGATVIMTRETDEDLSSSPGASLSAQRREDLLRRAEFANLSKPDLFLSVHANYYPAPRWYGAQAFYSREGAKGGKELAECIQEAMAKVTKRTWRSASDAINHYLLKAVKAPSCTVEIGFMSNPREAALLGDPEYQELLSWGIFTGVGYYLAKHGSEM